MIYLNQDEIEIMYVFKGIQAAEANHIWLLNVVSCYTITVILKSSRAEILDLIVASPREF